MKRFITVICIVVLCYALPAGAIVVMDFEGLQNLEPISNFYNGGLGGKGSGPGPGFGITFSSDSLAIISSLAGGTGNFQNNPSGNTVAFFLSGAGDLMNVPGGFDTGFSFFYSSINDPGSVTVYDDVSGTGNVVATLDLPVTPFDPNLPTNYNVWFPIGVSFNDMAKSVNFSGTANQIGFDNITLGSEIPGGSAIPEPATMLLLGSGLLGLAGYGRKKFLKK
jgi:hypothetical protein